MEPIETIERAGYVARIYHDEDASSPDDWDTFGALAYSDRRISVNPGDLPNDRYGTGMFEVDCPACYGDGEVGDNHDRRTECQHCSGNGYVTDGEQACRNMHDAVACLPVYATDGPYTIVRVVDSWDDANGWVYATQATADMTGVPTESYRDALVQDLEAWNQYLAGDVYGYVVTGPDGNDTDDACWGFYGIEYAVEEARSILESIVADGEVSA